MTTITVLNHDGNNVQANYANNLKFEGGSYQGSETRFHLRDGCDFKIATDVEGTGTYLNVDNTVNFLRTEAELQGFTGTYVAGTPGNSAQLWDQRTSFNTYPANISWGQIQLNNQGAAAINSFQSGSASATSDLRIGRSGTDALIGASAGANSYVSGDAAGDLVIETVNATNIWIAAGQVPSAKATPTGFNTYGSGTLTQAIVNTVTLNAQIVTIKPGTDGQALTLENAAGHAFALSYSAATLASSYLAIGGGAKIQFFSDTGFSDQTAIIDAATGIITTTTGHFAVDGTQVVGAQQTGWTAGTGTPAKGAFAAYAGQTWGASYSESVAQAADNAIAAASQRLLAIEQALATHGLINA